MAVVRGGQMRHLITSLTQDGCVVGPGEDFCKELVHQANLGMVLVRFALFSVAKEGDAVEEFSKSIDSPIIFVVPNQLVELTARSLKGVPVHL
jgi:hypothetical protein